jgi:hypothetical protein
MRGEAKNMINNYSGAIDDFTHIIYANPKNAKAFYRRGLDYIALKNKKSGCEDLIKAGNLGYFDSYEAINKYCKREKNQYKKKRKK